MTKHQSHRILTPLDLPTGPSPHWTFLLDPHPTGPSHWTLTPLDLPTGPSPHWTLTQLNPHLTGPRGQIQGLGVLSPSDPGGLIRLIPSTWLDPTSYRSADHRSRSGLSEGGGGREPQLPPENLSRNQNFSCLWPKLLGSEWGHVGDPGSTRGHPLQSEFSDQSTSLSTKNWVRPCNQQSIPNQCRSIDQYCCRWSRCRSCRLLTAVRKAQGNLV